MLIPVKGWILLLFIFAIVSGVYYRAYEQLPLPVSDDERVRTDLAQRWAQKVSLEVTRLPGRPSVAVARAVNDDNGILTDQLKRWIARRNVLMANDQWYSGIGYGLGTSEEPKSIDESCQAMLGHNIDYIVAAEVASWITYPEFEATLVGHVEIRDGKTGKTIVEYQLSLPEIMEVVNSPYRNSNDTSLVSLPAEVPESAATPTAVSGQTEMPKNIDAGVNSRHVTASSPSLMNASTIPGHEYFSFVRFGFLAWLALVCTLPLTWKKPLKRLLRRRCNQTNGFLLLAWTTATAVLAFLLWGRLMNPEPAILLCVIATAAACAYFGYLCNCLEKSG